MMLINRFEGSCGTFGEEKKTPLLLTTLGQFAQKTNLKTTTMGWMLA